MSDASGNDKQFSGQDVYLSIFEIDPQVTIHNEERFIRLGVIVPANVAREVDDLQLVVGHHLVK